MLTIGSILLYLYQYRIYLMQPDKLFERAPQQQQLLSQLKSWLYSAGASFDALQVQYLSQGYRGVVSTRTIQKREPIVFIPKSHLITLQMAKEDPISKEILEKKVELASPKHTYLAVFLLQQQFKGEKSNWRLYLQLLPKDLSNFPINYISQQLYELVGSPFLIQIHQKVYDLKRDYDKIYQASLDFRKYKFREFCWSRIIVGSRIFGLYINGLKTDILAPFADMLNHRLPKQTSWNYVDAKQGFVIESLQEIESGVQVFDSYGKKCNSRYLLNYGFVVEDNTENQVCLRVELDGPLKSRKLEMLQKNECLKILKLSANLATNNFYQSMGFLRFKEVSDPSQLAVLERISGIRNTGEPYVPTKTPPITVEIECAIWKTLQSLCQNALKEYSTSCQVDQYLLEQKSLKVNMKNIVIFRMGEKRVLLKLIEYSKEVISILKQGFEKSFEYYLANQQKDWAKYLGKILKLMPSQKHHKLIQQLPLSEVLSDDNQEAQQQLENN